MTAKKHQIANRGALIALLIGIIILCCIGFGTLANKTVRGEADNVVSSGNIKTKIHNLTGEGEEMPEWIYSILPGSTISNVVYAENTCEHAEWVRIKIIPECIDENGQQLSIEDITFNINSSDWIYKDGYYYYTKPLQPHQITSDLYDSIYFGTSLSNAYRKASFTASLRLNAVQVANNEDNVLEVTGWDT